MYKRQGYALVPELPITLSMLSRPLLLGRSHWYVIGCGDAGESDRMLERTWSEVAIYLSSFQHAR